ncbi:uncharacterized protein PV09_01312 [Verruconis gallopava]|uniref:Methyltransferase domain-containing protein n=1 Tax=Verruconis gallopava TaxID=253628 RepID=A0A0D2APB7_9PEZI|nr:uncharacterized protein PV09_01312 [Verruconis gallopava]KIW08400.1 hypothetical protein PV09_01312 [Verruconis gallopava]
MNSAHSIRTRALSFARNMRFVRPSICWRCAQSIFISPAAPRVPLRSYASRPKLAKGSYTGSSRPAAPSHGTSYPPTPSKANQRPKASPAGSSVKAWYDDDLHKDRPWARTFTISVIAISGTAFFGLIGWYGALYYNGLNQPAPEGDEQPIDLTAIYDEYAPHFDEDVDRTEYWNGIHTLRSRLVKQARGDVLESAAGTGRNAEYYVSSRIRSLTIVDKSAGMLAVAEKKWPIDRRGEDWTGRVRFVVGDVEEGLSAAQYDTVVQTLGLCSTDDPDRLMRSLAGLVKPGGKVLLIEHGRGWFEWLNRMLDQSARGHAAKHGCWWNRDIGEIVKRSGLEVVELSRTWRSLGTNWYVVLRKPTVLPDDARREARQRAS